MFLSLDFFLINSLLLIEKKKSGTNKFKEFVWPKTVSKNTPPSYSDSSFGNKELRALMAVKPLSEKEQKQFIPDQMACFLPTTTFGTKQIVNPQ